MTIRTILVPVRGDGKGEGVLDHALAIARRFNAHLTVVHTHARPDDMMPFASMGITDDMRRQIVEAATEAAQTEEEHLKALLQAYLKKNDVPIVDAPDGPTGKVTASWIEEAGQQSDNVGALGRLADLVAVPRPDSDSGLGSHTLEAALLVAGKPVLMVPPQPAGTIGAHVALGWDGGMESARAASAMMALMAAADKVTVFSAPVSTDPRLSVDKLCQYLAGHGIAAATQGLDVKATDVGQALIDGAKAAGADVLVMGAYGHSRARQMVMGGVTRHVVEHADLPVILIH